MPILEKASYFDDIVQGSRFISLTIKGHNPVQALHIALSGFAEEFGEVPDFQRTTIYIRFLTTGTLCQVFEAPESTATPSTNLKIG